MLKTLRRWACVVLGITVSGWLWMAVPRAEERPHFRSALQTTSQFVPIQLVTDHRCDDQAGHAPVLGVQNVVGAGDSTPLGAVVDQQSHCIRADLTFFNGHFTITNATGKSMTGRYSGRLVPTFNSTFPVDAPPGGQWLIIGTVCLTGDGVGDEDCSEHQSYPARGITNLNTGDASIFIARSDD